LVVIYRRFGKIFQFHLRGSSSPRRIFSLGYLTLQDVTDRLSETSATNHQSRLRRNQEERRSHLHGGGSLKSRRCSLLTGESVSLLKSRRCSLLTGEGVSLLKSHRCSLLTGESVSLLKSRRCSLLTGESVSLLKSRRCSLLTGETISWLESIQRALGFQLTFYISNYRVYRVELELAYSLCSSSCRPNAPRPQNRPFVLHSLIPV